MRILHISDAHWCASNAKDLDIVVQALLRDLDVVAPDRNIDAFVFSGDLVLAGENGQDFEKAFTAIIQPIASLLKLQSAQIIICPGNHDMSRKSARAYPMIESSGKQGLKDHVSINRFLDLSDNDLEKSALLDRSGEYLKWYRTKFPNDMVNAFYAFRILEINGEKVGFAIVNTAFRATGESENCDDGNLIVGERNVEECLAHLSECEFKFFVGHHPTDLLVPEDRKAVELRLEKHFDVHMFGHMHASRPEMTNRPLGSIISAQAGSLFAGRKWFNGYQVLNIDLENGKVRFEIREYQPKVEEFDVGTSVARGGLVEYQFGGKTDHRGVIAKKV